MSGIARHHAEWLSLIEVSGPFLTPPVLIRAFPQGLPKVDGKKLGRLRAAYEEWANAQEAKASDAGALHTTWVQLVLVELLEFDQQTLRSGDGLPSNLAVSLAEHRETLQPSMAIVEPTGRAKAGTPRLLLSLWPSDQDLESAAPAARWAATPLERMTQLCRSTGIRLGLVTNGERWALVDAPVGQTAGYASWYAGLWLQEPITLAAFEALLGVRRFFAVADTDTVEALLDESVAFQQEVTDQLGYQVRRAVEVLVQALDRADLDRSRELLRDVPPARLYDAALTVMMRLVFLFCAEERGLLPLGDQTYDANYAVSTLRALLREEADRVGVEVLERRQDAWARLLATFRAVHGGIEHEALRLPALGGSLFDPDRFPFLEGRAAGTSWREEPASPLPIDNRTVLHLLEALQLLRSRGDGGRAEARKLSYRALDIEQIGHVYEGLLDHIAVRVDADMLGLTGTKDKEPELSIVEVERERHRGKDKLIEFLKEHTGRSTSGLRNDLDATLDEDMQQRLLVACGNDKALLKRVAPYHALLRADVWGYPQIYRASSLMVTGGPERRQTGTHYTHKSLTERIVTETLEPLVYVGPAEGKPRDAWTLRSAAELLDLKICDMAMGSGAFLVQVCRWLAERVVEAWEEAERQGASISANGEVLEKAAGRDLLSSDRDERLSYARRLVAERCVYGVDINPMAVELAKLSLWLITLAKGRPFGFLDHNLRSGDSLLGITSLEQLENFHLDPVRGKNLHHTLFDPRHEIQAAVTQALDLRQRLRAIRILDIEDVRVMACLYDDAKRELLRAELAADLLIGASFATAASRNRALDEKLVELAAAFHRGTSAQVDVDTLAKAARDLLDTECPERQRQRRPFHWVINFPEVFVREGPGFDAVVGNPPFLGGRRIRSEFGEIAQAYFVGFIAGGGSANADLCAYFFRRAGQVIRPSGTMGLVGTNSIGQGATREQGLARLVGEGFCIYSAISNYEWPGAAGVTVAEVCLIRGRWNGRKLLDGKEVPDISSYLSPTTGELSPVELSENLNVAFQGSNVLGAGFVLSIEQARQIVQASHLCRDVVQPFVRGEDFNSSPTQSPAKYIINFRDMPLNREVAPQGYKGPVAADYPDCLGIVEAFVRPQRRSAKRDAYRNRWWQYAERCDSLYAAVAGLARVIFHASPSKHICFGFAMGGAVYSGPHTVIASDRVEDLAVLQSSIHTEWAWEFCSTMRNSGIRFNPSDYRRFPRPHSLPVEFPDIAEAFHKARQATMKARGIGLTTLYNMYHSESVLDEDVAALRRTQEQIDTLLLRAYGWPDLKLSLQFCSTKQGTRFTLRSEVRQELIRRLVTKNLRRNETPSPDPDSEPACVLRSGRARRAGDGRNLFE